MEEITSVPHKLIQQEANITWFYNQAEYERKLKKYSDNLQEIRCKHLLNYVKVHKNVKSRDKVEIQGWFYLKISVINILFKIYNYLNRCRNIQVNVIYLY